MSPEVWIAFTLASVVLLATPGPTVTLVVAYALGSGRRSGWATVPGVTLGDLTAMTVSLLGAGAILELSATMFTLFKLLGAAYLVWLGVQKWRSQPDPEIVSPKARPAARKRMFWGTYVVTALNPKGVIFFGAFLPQFVNTGQPLLPQYTLLGLTFLILAAINTTLWAVLAGEMRARFKRPSALRWLNRVGGGFLIGTGLLFAAARRAAPIDN